MMKRRTKQNMKLLAKQRKVYGCRAFSDMMLIRFDGDNSFAQTI